MSNTFAARSDSLWFEYLGRRQETRAHLFCFPYAGGSAQVFRAWQGQFAPELSVCLVHLPGRHRRIGEASFTRLHSLVDVLVEQFAGEMPGQFAFYGHSMGALISFELGRELFRRYKRGPQHLFVSGCRAPQLPPSMPAIFDRPDNEFIAKLRGLNGTPEEVLANPQSLALFLPTLRADFELVDTYDYRPGPPLPCPLNAYGGLQDSNIAVEALRGWQQQTTADFKLRMFDGDHFFIHNSQAGFIQVLRSDVLAAFQRSPVPEP